MADLLAGLNNAQRQAVTHRDGPLLVLAGPGSGKTRVITHRIAYMIDQGIDPARILALTFTNKAADEMRQRLERLVPGRPVFAGTFHRFSARLLRRYADKMGLDPGFSILDPSEVGTLVKSIMKKMQLDVTHTPPEGVARRISSLKNDLVLPDLFVEQATDYFDRQVAEIYPRVVESMRSQNVVDFDDLLLLVAQLLRTDAEIRARLDRQYEYVLVDEYQDTNVAQYAIARGLSVDYQNLCATGDPDQSVYSWRGANIANILHFEEDFPGATVVRLEQNYRSVGNILAVADHLIRHNVDRKHKDLTTENPPGLPVRVVCHRDDTAEARSTADAIRDGVDTGQRSYRDYAIFVRVSSLSRTFEQVFRSRNIPYQVIGGYSFFERREVRDLLAYVRLLLNPRDASALARVASAPPKGIGATTLERVIAHAGLHQLSLIEVCRHADDVPGLKKKQIVSLRDLCMLMDELAEAPTLSPVAGLIKIIDLVEYRPFVRTLGDEDEEQNREGVLDDLIASAQEMQMEDPSATLADFMESISLASDQDRRDPTRDIVTIMTLHAAKGLEFPVVFIAGFEDRIIPHQRAVEERGEEEERRLLFVGITRAEEELTLSYARVRSFQGSRTFAAPSPFLLEIPTESVDRQDVVIGGGYERSIDPDASQETGYEEPFVPIYRGSSAPSPADLYKKGMWVRHAEYGDGVILQIEGVGDSRKATIHFSAAGTKRFVLSKAALEPVGH
ncbi:UvrD-helicase domain-containing protein [bacterium]|nr:UvrD-helicase domain-containing protein [bacterium]